MAIVIIPSVLRDAAEGMESVEIEGATLRHVMDSLVRRFPGLKPRLLDDQGVLHHYLALFVDGVEVRYSDGFLMPLTPDAEVVIVPALGGGR